LIWDYLPQLIPRIDPHNSTIHLPRRDLPRREREGTFYNVLINKGVNLRNDLVHRNPKSVNAEIVETILLTVRDLLWILDYLRGHTWAIGFVSDAARTEWGLVPTQR